MRNQSPSKDQEFIAKLSDRIGRDLGDGASICGQGFESVVVASGDSAYKCYSTTVADPSGLWAGCSEVAALKAFGGYRGKHIRTSSLQGYRRFDTPFVWKGRKFVSMVQQSFMHGDKFTLAGAGEPYRLGQATAEFHTLLSARGQFDLATRANHNIARIEQLKHESRDTPILSGYLLNRLEKSIMRLAFDQARQRVVHGDFFLRNILDGDRRVTVLDHSSTGVSIAEQDMTEFAMDGYVLREIFDGYASVSGVTPDKRAASLMYVLQLAMTAAQYRRSGNIADSRDYARCAEALLT